VTLSAAAALGSSDMVATYLQSKMPIQTKLPIHIAVTTTVLSLGLLSVLGLVALHYKSLLSTPKIAKISDLQFNILSLIARYHSQEIPATPKQIAADLNMVPETVLAHMVEYHNDQFITFRNGGKKPETDTAYFLGEKAWQQMKIIKTP